ncbi:MAG: recombinase family protein [Fuerstiella sp.]
MSRQRKHKKNDTTNRRRRIAVYIRVSTPRQVREGDSLEAQQNAIKAYIKAQRHKSGWEGAEIIYLIEKGRSAKNQKRAELQKLRKLIQRGEVDTVICTKLDRITRSIIDFADLLELIQSHDIEFISLYESFDTSTAMGRAMLIVIMTFAQLERETTGERTLATMEDRVCRGLWNGGWVHGYVLDPEGTGKLVLDETTAEIIKVHFFDAVEKLGSAGAVQRELRKKQIKVPKHECRSGRIMGGDWFSKQQVVRLLRNPVYIGRIVWGNASKDDSHSPIVSKEQFDRVQRILDETTVTRSNAKQSRGRGYPLRGLVRCGCGCMMTPKSANGRGGKKYPYYECTRKSHMGREECDAVGIPAEALEEAVLKRVSELCTDEAARKKIVAEALKLIDKNAQEAEQDLVIVRNQLSTVKAELGRLVAVLKQMGTEILGSIKDEFSRLENEKSELEARVLEFQTQKLPLDAVTAQARVFVEGWTGLGDILDNATPDEKAGILKHYVEVVELQQATGEGGKCGKYGIRLFPEAAVLERPEGTQPKRANGDGLLTEPPLVREVDEKAPLSKRSS